MICEVCGANAVEVRPGHYRCNYCTNEFDAPGYTPAPSAPTTAGANNVSADGHRILSGEEIYDSAISSVVEVYAANKPEDGVMCSSGFVVSDQGFVLTNAHAVLDPFGQICKIIQVKAHDGVYNALVVAIGKPADGENDSIDLCLLYAEGLSADPNEIGDASVLKNGQKVYLIGNSLGSGTCITSGIISDKERAMPGLSYPYIMTDAAANHGNSGGPLYNEYGEVIGVLVAGIDGAKGMNYAIPSNVVDAFMQYVISGTKFKKADLGSLNKYSHSSANYTMTLSMAFTGIKLILDVIEYIVGLFKK